MSPNISSDNREFFNQLKIYFESQKVEQENTEALRKQIESENNNNPALNAFKAAQTGASNGALSAAVGDQYKSKETKKEEDDNPISKLLAKVSDFLGLDEEEEEPFADLMAYSNLIPRANIPGTLKEYELMQKVFA
jgi:hypothetical protein